MNNELYHHGIKGQKWGRRRWQNEDGTYTETGKERYFGDSQTDEKKSHKQKLIDKYIGKGLPQEEADRAAKNRIRAEKIIIASAAVTMVAASAYIAKKHNMEKVQSFISEQSAEINRMHNENFKELSRIHNENFKELSKMHNNNFNESIRTQNKQLKERAQQVAEMGRMRNERLKERAQQVAEMGRMRNERLKERAEKAKQASKFIDNNSGRIIKKSNNSEKIVRFIENNSMKTVFFNVNSDRSLLLK